MDANLSHTFSERIRGLRAELGMNQGQFADFVGVSRGAMSYYEQEARTPDIGVLKSICEKCNVSADYMLGIIPDKNHVVSDVCLETGLYPKAVKRLRLLKQIQAIKSEDILKIIVSEFDEPDEALKLTPYTATPAMVNLFLAYDEGLQILTMLSAIIFDGYLCSEGERVKNPMIALPKSHNYLQAEYEFKNVTAALWVTIQEETAKLRDSLRESESFKDFYEYQAGNDIEETNEDGQQ